MGAFSDDLKISVKKQKFTGKHGEFEQNAVLYKILKSSKTIAKYMDAQKEMLQSVSVPNSKTEALAFWINAYNFFTLLDVKENVELTSNMMDRGWKNKIFNVAGKTYSLDEIEHKIIRPLNDARIHFAVNCASVSCPTLINEIFTKSNLNENLDALVKNALKNPLHLNVIDGETHTTKLFEWFADDFDNFSGSVTNFIKRYAPAGTPSEVIITDIEYNWQLNNKENITKSVNAATK